MVRRSRKSHAAGEEKVKPSRGIEPAYGGKPGSNPYVVYADLQKDGDPTPRILILNFAAKYAAAYFINKLIHGNTWEECEPIGSREGIRTASGVRITMFNKDIWPLLEYKPTDAEAAWEDEGVDKSVLRFKYGRHEEVKRRDDNEQDEAGSDGDSGEGKTKPKRQKSSSPREPKAKVDKSGHVSANDIAKELKLEGREIRGILRGSKLEKPAHGWSWPKDSKELKEIRKLIEAGVKELKKKKGKK